MKQSSSKKPSSEKKIESSRPLEKKVSQSVSYGKVKMEKKVMKKSPEPKPEKVQVIKDIDKNVYRRTADSQYLLKYHLLIITRRKIKYIVTGDKDEEVYKGAGRKIKYKIPKEFVLETALKACAISEIEVGSIIVKNNYVSMYVSAPPILGPQQLVRKLQKYLAARIYEKYKEIKTVEGIWSRKYAISTEPIDQEFINAFLDSVPKQ